MTSDRPAFNVTGPRDANLSHDGHDAIDPDDAAASRWSRVIVSGIAGVVATALIALMAWVAALGTRVNTLEVREQYVSPAVAHNEEQLVETIAMLSQLRTELAVIRASLADVQTDIADLKVMLSQRRLRSPGQDG